MPTYAYRGSACDHEFETVQKFADAPLSECIVCGGPVRRVVQPVGVVFKGSGWYINDSRKTSTSKAGSGEKGDSSDKGDSADKGDSSGKVASADAKESSSSEKTGSKAPAAAKERAKTATKSAD